MTTTLRVKHVGSCHCLWYAMAPVELYSDRWRFLIGFLVPKYSGGGTLDELRVER